MKIKIFNNYDSSWELEQAVNTWLKDNKSIYIVDIKYSNESVMIIYNEGIIDPNLNNKNKIREVIGLEPMLS